MAKIVLDPKRHLPHYSLVLQENWDFQTKRRAKRSKSLLKQQKMLQLWKDAPGMVRLNISSCEWKQ